MGIKIFSSPEDHDVIIGGRGGGSVYSKMFQFLEGGSLSKGMKHVKVESRYNMKMRGPNEKYINIKKGKTNYTNVMNE